jgi:hypothetical protein
MARFIARFVCYPDSLADVVTQDVMTQEANRQPLFFVAQVGISFVAQVGISAAKAMIEPWRRGASQTAMDCCRDRQGQSIPIAAVEPTERIDAGALRRRRSEALGNSRILRPAIKAQGLSTFRHLRRLLVSEEIHRT